MNKECKHESWYISDSEGFGLDDDKIKVTLACNEKNCNEEREAKLNLVDIEVLEFFGELCE